MKVCDNYTLGYAFLLFNEEESIHKLVMSCLEEDDKHYMYISSPTYKEKKVKAFTVFIENYPRGHLKTKMKIFCGIRLSKQLSFNFCCLIFCFITYRLHMCRFK